MFITCDILNFGIIHRIVVNINRSVLFMFASLLKWSYLCYPDLGRNVCYEIFVSCDARLAWVTFPLWFSGFNLIHVVLFQFLEGIILCNNKIIEHWTLCSEFLGFFFVLLCMCLLKGNLDKYAMYMTNCWSMHSDKMPLSTFS